MKAHFQMKRRAQRFFENEAKGYVQLSQWQ